MANPKKDEVSNTPIPTPLEEPAAGMKDEQLELSVASDPVVPSRRLSAEQEAGRKALQRKYSPEAKENEKGKGNKKS